MWLACIEPDEPDHDKRTFECPACPNVTVKIVNYRSEPELGRPGEGVTTVGRNLHAEALWVFSLGSFHEPIAWLQG